VAIRCTVPRLIRAGRLVIPCVLFIFLPSQADVAPDQALLPPSLSSQLLSITRDALDRPPRHLSRWAARQPHDHVCSPPARARRLFAAQNGNGRTTVPSGWTRWGRGHAPAVQQAYGELRGTQRRRSRARARRSARSAAPSPPPRPLRRIDRCTSGAGAEQQDASHNCPRVCRYLVR
jgi:hypothetical protein